MASFTADFGPTAGDYARHRAGFPESLFDRLEALGIVRPGSVALDLGTGTGSLARGLARRGCRVTGLDPSAAMLAEARRLAHGEGLAIDFVASAAEATGLPAEAFDVVSAGQCWHWLDGAAAAREARRLLRPGGRVLLCHFDWLPLPGGPVEATEGLVRAHNPAWPWGGRNGLHPAGFDDLPPAGFGGLESLSYDENVSYSHEAWRGRIRASAGVGGSLAPEAVARFDAALAALLARDFPEEPLSLPHRVFVLFAAKPGNGAR